MDKIALLDFYAPTLPHGKYFQNDGVLEREGFASVHDAFDYYFHEFGDDTKILAGLNSMGNIIKQAPVDWEMMYLGRELEAHKDYITSDLILGFFSANRRHQLFRVPFKFGAMLQIGEVFHWDCLEKHWIEFDTFLSDKDIKVAFLVTGKSYENLGSLFIQVRVCVYDNGMADWQDHYVNNNY